MDLLQADICRYAISRVDNNYIVWHQVARVDAFAFSTAHDGGATWKQITEALARALGTIFLHKREQAVEQNDDENGKPELRHAREKRQDARDPQHDRKEVNELGNEPSVQ